MTDLIKRCPMCAEEIRFDAKKCKHCGTLLERPDGLTASPAVLNDATDVAKPTADFGIVLLILPLIATFLVVFWVSSMNLLQSPEDTMTIILLAVVVLTAAVAAMEANALGMQSNRQRGTYGPMAWFILLLMLWIVGYPAYLYKRRHYGVANLLVGGVLVGLIFLGSWSFMMWAIEEQKAEVRANVENVQRVLRGEDAVAKTSPPADRGNAALPPATLPQPGTPEVVQAKSPEVISRAVLVKSLQRCGEEALCVTTSTGETLTTNAFALDADALKSLDEAAGLSASRCFTDIGGDGKQLTFEGVKPSC